jgi:hypothetical protein
MTIVCRLLKAILGLSAVACLAAVTNTFLGLLRLKEARVEARQGVYVGLQDGGQERRNGSHAVIKEPADRMGLFSKVGRQGRRRENKSFLPQAEGERMVASIATGVSGELSDNIEMERMKVGGHPQRGASDLHS